MFLKLCLQAADVSDIALMYDSVKFFHPELLESFTFAIFVFG